MNITKNIKGTSYRLKIEKAEDFNGNKASIENLSTQEKISEVKLTNKNGYNRLTVKQEDKERVEDFLGLDHIEGSAVKFQLTEKQIDKFKKEKRAERESQGKGIRGFGDPVEGTKAGNSLEGGKITEEGQTPRHPTEEQVYQ